MRTCFQFPDNIETFTPIHESGTIRVTIQWDGDARVYVATSEDVVGLVLESEDMEDLKKRVVASIPELIELNGAVCQDVRH